jgi:hypothetical protein
VIFAQPDLRETQPVYLRPETFLTVALIAGLIYVVLFAAGKVIEHR